MQRRVTEISVDAQMQEAARILADAEVTGAPVVDAAGHCVGVLSATDFAKRELQRAEGEEVGEFRFEHMLVKKTSFEPLQIVTIASDCVGEHMTTAVQTIYPGATLLQAARVMIGEHIHRLVVVDEDGRTEGILSSLDVINAVVGAVEE